MKRTIISVLILLCAGSVFAQVSGVITELSGTVELKPAGAADFAAAKAGDSVARDTVVSTGFKSSALITVGSAALTVRPLTRLSLAEISASAGSETLNVSLQTGRVRVDLNPPAGAQASMSVRSPVATASVRGTNFEFDTQSLKVLEGTVAFQGSSGGEMMVGAGASSEILDNGRAADPIETGMAELMPPPLAGTDAGFRSSGSYNQGGMPVEEKGEFSITFFLH